MQTPTNQQTNQGQTTPRRRRLQGVVVKTAMQDTVTVLVERLFPHRRLRRVMGRSRKYLVHDPAGAVRVGDTVSFEETRPISKRKRHRIVEVLKAAPGEDALPVHEENV